MVPRRGCRIGEACVPPRARPFPFLPISSLPVPSRPVRSGPVPSRPVPSRPVPSPRASYNCLLGRCAFLFSSFDNFCFLSLSLSLSLSTCVLQLPFGPMRNFCVKNKTHVTKWKEMHGTSWSLPFSCASYSGLLGPMRNFFCLSFSTFPECVLQLRFFGADAR